MPRASYRSNDPKNLKFPQLLFDQKRNRKPTHYRVDLLDIELVN